MKPKFYDDPVFTVPEAATVAGTTESALRSMLARGGASYVGMRRDGRTLFSCHELFLLSIAADLTAFGLEGGFMWRTAESLAGSDAFGGPEPSATARVYKNDDGVTAVEWRDRAEDFEPLDRAHVVLPLAAICRRVVHKASGIYSMGAA